MRKLSTGQDSIFENWITLSTMAFGKNGKATEFLKKKADESPNGLQEQVIADESQLILMLAEINNKK